MIADDALTALATKLQTTELNVRREYFQHRFLSYFFQQPLTDQVFFKGGTALRILYQSPRFSEDLDFSSATGDVRGLEEALLETLAEMAHENLNPELEESKKTTGGYLGLIAFRAKDHEPVSIQLEISLRAGQKQGEVMTIVSDFSPAYLVVALTQAQLVDEKIQALLSRRKARDFYDLYFILRANLLAPQHRAVLPQALETLRRSRLNFERELKEFLPRSHRALLRDFPAALAREIERFL
jgi:predicted nucleotidyltransferase component of viral defense system